MNESVCFALNAISFVAVIVAIQLAIFRKHRQPQSRLFGAAFKPDVGEIRARTEALQESSHKLAEAVYATILPGVTIGPTCAVSRPQCVTGRVSWPRKRGS